MPPLAFGVHAMVMVAFGVSQPLFDLLGRHVEFLVAHHVEPRDLVSLTLALSPLGPVALGACAAGLAWGLGRAALPFQLAAIGVLAVVIALPPLNRIGGAPAWLLAALGLGLGAAGALAYSRWAGVRSTLCFLSPVLLLFPAFFLLGSPAISLLEPPHREIGAGAHAAPAPVVVVVFDGLALDHLLDHAGAIDARRHPAFATLARCSTWFRNATTVADRSSYAIPAILTGRIPLQKRPATVREYPENLFTLLAGSRVIDVVELVTHLCPSEVCVARAPGPEWRVLVSDLSLLALHMLLPDPWTDSLPVVDATWTDFAGARPTQMPAENGAPSEVNLVFGRFLDGIQPGERSALHFIHLGIPHEPYLYLPSGRQYGPLGVRPYPRGLRGGRWSDDEWAVTQTQQRHLLQVAFADALLGRLIERLEETDLFDRSLLVVTSDHGMSFRIGEPARSFSAGNAGSILSIPLLFKAPRQRSGRVDDRNAETIDILPTVLDALGLSPPPELDGSSLLGGQGERPRKVVTVSSRAEPRGRKLVDLPARLPGRAERLQELHARFDASAGIEGLMAVGPHRELLGRSLDSLQLAVPDGTRVEIVEAEAFEHVDPRSGVVPARVVGDIEGASPGTEPLDLAIAANGTVRATTRGYRTAAGKLRFSAMLPESALRRGKNQLEVFLIQSGLAPPVLMPTQLRSRPGYRVALDEAGFAAVLLSDRGCVHAVHAGLLTGHVLPHGAVLKGLVRGRPHRLPERVVLFSEGRFLVQVPLSGPPPGRPWPPHFRDFEMLVPPTHRAEFREAAVSAFGVSGGMASQLGYGSLEPVRIKWEGPAVELRIATQDAREGVRASSGDWLPIHPSRRSRAAAVLVFVEDRFSRIVPSAEVAAALSAERSARAFAPNAGGGLAELLP